MLLYKKNKNELHRRVLNYSPKYNSSLISNICSVSVPFIALYCQYDSIIRSIGLTLATILSFISLLFCNRVRVYKPFLCFSLFYIIRRTINLFGPYGGINRAVISEIVTIILVAFSMLIISSNINSKLMHKTWIALALFVSVLVILQSIRCYLLNQMIYPIKIGPVDYSYEIWKTPTNRPSACFTEPTMVCLFLAPALIISINKKQYVLAILFSTVMLLTTSTNGIIILISLWGGKVILSDEISIKNKLLLSSAALIVGIFVAHLSVFSASMSKLSSEIEGTSNSFVRIFFGFETFNNIPLHNKIIGIFDPSVAELRMSGRIKVTVINKKIYHYVNSISAILIYSGIAGTILWVRTAYCMIKDIEKEYLPYLLMYLILMFCTATFYNTVSLMTVLFVLCSLRANKTNWKYVL